MNKKASELRRGDLIYRIVTRINSGVSIFRVINIVEANEHLTFHCDMIGSTSGDVKEGNYEFEFAVDDTEAIDESVIPYTDTVHEKIEFYFTEYELRVAVDNIYHPQLAELKKQLGDIEVSIEVIDKLIEQRNKTVA